MAHELGNGPWNKDYQPSGISKAEEAAWKKYPKEDGKMWTSAFGTFEFDRNAPERKAYHQGYEQAEKDLALTWEDIKRIDDLMMEVLNSIAVGELPEMGIKEIYQEVLKRFNQTR